MRARTRKSRANGQGSLERRRNGIYVARWMVDGIRFSRSTGERDRKVAEKRLHEFMEPFRLGNERDRAAHFAMLAQTREDELKALEEAQPAMSLEDAWKAYETSAERPDCSERTLFGYRRMYAAFLEWLKGHDPSVAEIRQVTRIHAEAYAQHLRETRSATTHNNNIATLKAVWRTVSDGDGARPQGMQARIAENPWERIRRRSQHESHTRRELTVEELHRVVEPLEGEMRTLFAIGIYTGLRLGDAALLDWGSVDLAAGRIRLVPRKTARHAHGKPVVIPVHLTLAGILSQIPQPKRRGPVMPGIAKTYARDPGTVSKQIQRAFRAAGIETTSEREGGARRAVDVGFHSLRHTFVSLSANAGAPLAVVQSMVGHSSPAMTRHYFHESEQALISAVAQLPDISGGPVEWVADSAPLKAFKAAFLALDAEGRAAARAWLEGVD